MRVAIAVLLGALAGACATPQESKGAQSPAAGKAPVQQASAKQAAAKEDRVCKRVTPTGSNMPQRVCHSKDEWAAIENRDLENADNLNRDLRNAPNVH